MLQTYTEIDERVRTLGYIMKVFAKVVNSQSCISLVCLVLMQSFSISLVMSVSRNQVVICLFFFCLAVRTATFSGLLV